MFKREVFYEVHVKGFSMLNKDIEKSKRGKFLGLCSKWALDHYKELGVTVIQIMPIMKNDPKSTGKFWGYGPISFFELNPEYGTEAELIETIKTLHEHGFKVISDQIFNHTGCKIEGLDYDHTDRYGCGYPVSNNEPNSLKMIKKSITYLLDTLNLDGIRFDLGACLLREIDGSINPNSKIIKWLEDKYSKTKIFTAECYDWHGNYRNVCPEWLWRISNSIRDQIRDQQQYIHTLDGKPERNVGFVTVHDGQTLLDNCSFQGKYNYCNKEDNRDGNNDNKADNCTVEGFTDDPQILCWRQARADSMLKALQNYTGHVLLLQGDVAVDDDGNWIGRMTNSQFGCNNSYCQDNPLGWVIWEKLNAKQLKLLQHKYNPVQ
jgi:isoamylase